MSDRWYYITFKKIINPLNIDADISIWDFVSFFSLAWAEPTQLIVSIGPQVEK